MAEPFVSEIRMMSFGYPPKGWALCNGQLMPINQNQALFVLLGTAFGGDGRTTFALPDLRGRTPIHAGQGRVPGVKGGEQAHTLSIPEMPIHTHTLNGTTANANSIGPGGNVLARGTTAVGSNPINYYTTTISNLVQTQPATVGNAGGSQPHQNMQPYLTISFCIALQGIFPSQN